MTPAEVVAQARLAVEKGQWQVALALLSEHEQVALGGQALELKAMASYGDGQFEAAVAAWEELHSQSLREGDDEEAARAASMVAMYLMMDTGLMAPVRGWLHRATRLLMDRAESPVQALVAMVRTYERFMCGDMEEARRQAGLAIELGERHEVQPAIVIGSVAFARIKILDGCVEEGIALLNDVGALLMSGVVDPLTTGMMYCELICAAQGLAMYEMASEWTEVMEHWRHGAAFGGINGRCRVHRAEMLRISGPCDAAEEEALQACDELRPWMRREFGWPLTELGNIRLRRGDLDGAEEAFMAASEHAWSPQPGLSLLRLAQGDAAAAGVLIADAIDDPVGTPSKERPPFGDLRLAPLLDAQVQIASVAGDIAACQTATDSLQIIAETYSSPSLDASAALCRSRTELLRGNLETAAEKASEAITIWTEVGAPYETATARMVFGEVHQRAGNERLAQLERRMARAGFEAFGVKLAAEPADYLETRQVLATPGIRAERSATFKSEGDVRSVCFAGETAVLRDLKGFRYIQRLLAEPNREFHVLDMVAFEQGTLPVGQPPKGVHQAGLVVGGGALPMLDDEARRAYRQRLVEVDEDIERAIEMNDVGRKELAERDRSYLVAELSRAVGLGGSHRSIGGDSERARSAVARSVRYSLGRLAEQHSKMASHLELCVRTGTYCSYVPDPLVGIDWITSAEVVASNADGRGDAAQR